VVAKTPSWQPAAPAQPLLPPLLLLGAIDCTWAYIVLGLLGATAMSMRPSWSPVVVLTYGLRLPAVNSAPAWYALPATSEPKTNPLALPAIDVKVGQPLAGTIDL